MPHEQPWFELRTAHDLLGKVRRDLKRVEVGYIDADAAFNFFVTAYHVLDWWKPGRRNAAERKRIVGESIVLQICRNLANGAKHLELYTRPDRPVAELGTHHGAFSHGFSRDFDVTHLVVRLDGAAAEALGSEIDVYALAIRVVEELERLLGCESGGT